MAWDEAPGRWTGESFEASRAHVASLMAHAGVLLVLGFLIARLGPDRPDAETVGNDVGYLLRALDAIAERERDRAPPVDDGMEPAPGQGGDGRRGGGTGTRAAGEEGPTGSSVAPRRDAHLSSVGKAHAVTMALASTPSPAEVLAGLIPALSAPGTVRSTWDPPHGEGAETRDARAPLWGHGIDDAFSWGGLGLSGAGEGGGGRAAAMGLGSLGAIGRGAGTGTNAAFGPDDGRGGIGEGAGGYGEGIGIGTFGSFGRDGGGGDEGVSDGWGMRGGHHVVRSPRIGCGGGTLVNGRLPPEAIQRVVRQNLGRFRACYERGLVRQPSLEGRVVARFLIVRDGSVGFAADGGSSLPDASVSACVVRAFAALSFPEPQGGTVLVEYPLSLSPE